MVVVRSHTVVWEKSSSMNRGGGRVVDALRRIFVGKGVVYHGVVVAGMNLILVKNLKHIRSAIVQLDMELFRIAKI